MLLVVMAFLLSIFVLLIPLLPFSLLNLFFNMCILHGYIPKPCINTVIVPILKNKNGNHQDCGNYRPIAIATVVSKLFEQVIFVNIKNFLDTIDNQFGFKTKHSTDMCVLFLSLYFSS